jgi:acetyltransferase-like isoleucine patch superfamily enzyme
VGITIHPSALCESASIGAGTRIWAFAHVMPGAVIGRACNIGDHCFVEGGARLGDRVTVKNGVSVWEGVMLSDDVFVGPNVAFTNDPLPRAIPHRTQADDLLPTVVRQSATLGANSTIMCGHVIGRHAFVAAGSVVTRDVPAHVLVMGAPARPAGWICQCGQQLDTLACDRCGTRFTRQTDDGLRIETTR